MIQIKLRTVIKCMHSSINNFRGTFQTENSFFLCCFAPVLRLWMWIAQSFWVPTVIRANTAPTIHVRIQNLNEHLFCEHISFGSFGWQICRNFIWTTICGISSKCDSTSGSNFRTLKNIYCLYYALSEPKEIATTHYMARSALYRSTLIAQC